MADPVYCAQTYLEAKQLLEQAVARFCTLLHCMRTCDDDRPQLGSTHALELVYSLDERFAHGLCHGVELCVGVQHNKRSQTGERRALSCVWVWQHNKRSQTGEHMLRIVSS